MADDTRLGDRYELGGLLGRGGMATVRHAVDTRLDRPVAVKQLVESLAADPVCQTRFQREARSAASLSHPAIVAVFDTGAQDRPESGLSVPYLVMELVDGQTLRKLLNNGERLQPERAVEITRDVLGALAHSHSAGIVHRDIKPANVMITEAGKVKVMDFGIARTVTETSTDTRTASVVGTAHYLSPEQARGEKVGVLSDVYSTGCLLYELLVGRPPFVGESVLGVIYQHVREAPVPPSRLDPAVTSDLDAVVLKALAKEPADRYASAAEMAADLDEVLAGRRPAAAEAVQAVGASDWGWDRKDDHSRDGDARGGDDRDGDDRRLAATGSRRAAEPRRRGAAVVLALMLAMLGLGGYGLQRALGPSVTSGMEAQAQVPVLPRGAATTRALAGGAASTSTPQRSTSAVQSTAGQSSAAAPQAGASQSSEAGATAVGGGAAHTAASRNTGTGTVAPHSGSTSSSPVGTTARHDAARQSGVGSVGQQPGSSVGGSPSASRSAGASHGSASPGTGRSTSKAHSPSQHRSPSKDRSLSKNRSPSTDSSSGPARSSSGRDASPSRATRSPSREQRPSRRHDGPSTSRPSPSRGSSDAPSSKPGSTSTPEPPSSQPGTGQSSPPSDRPDTTPRKPRDGSSAGHGRAKHPKPKHDKSKQDKSKQDKPKQDRPKQDKPAGDPSKDRPGKGQGH